MDIIAVPPAPDGRGGDAVLAGLFAIRDAGGGCLDFGTDLRCRRPCLCSLMSMNLLPDELLKKLSGG